MHPSDWPLSTVRLTDWNLAEWFIWTGWCIPEALHDLPNLNSAWPWRVEINTEPDEHYMWIVEPGWDVYDAVYEILTHISKAYDAAEAALSPAFVRFQGPRRPNAANLAGKLSRVLLKSPLL
jgi:hypothetical protein